MLQMYQGGQAELWYPNFNKVVGEITKIQFFAEAIDLEFAWVAHKGYRKRKWLKNPNITEEASVILRRGWERISETEILIHGDNCSAFLRPAEHCDNVPQPK